MHRDRRSFRRPAGAPASGAPEGAQRPVHERGGERPPGDPRAREGYRGGERRWAGPQQRPDFRPYQSPYFNIAFYPEDVGFTALAKAMRTSCRTYELFEIARLILGKPDRFVVVLARKSPEEAASSAPPAAAPPAPAAPRTPTPIYMALPDNLPFDTEEAALAHVIGRHMDLFFDKAVVEVEPPKGSFPFVNRCTLSGELLGPPNYHRYQQIVQQHHATRFPRMSFEEFRERIETVRDPAVVAQWLDKMKQATRYTWKLGAPGDAPVAFDSIEDARAHLLANARDRLVKPVETARFHGKVLDQLPEGEIRRGIEGHYDRQRRFPLDTANALRGRLRREGFTIFKKGAKGISYVCAIKRKFRVPGQAFAETIGSLIAFIETNPMIPVKELPVKLLGITPVGTPSTPPLSIATPAGEAAAPQGDAPSAPPAVEDVPAAAATEPALAPEEQEKLRRLTMDLHWLVHEGYVTEFADGRLFTPPPMPESRVRAAESAEGEENDPVAFPEVPASAPAEPEPGPSEADAGPAPEPAVESPAPAAPEPAAESPDTTPPSPVDVGSPGEPNEAPQTPADVPPPAADGTAGQGQS